MHTQSYRVLTNANITSTTATPTIGRSNSNREEIIVACSNIKYCGNDFFLCHEIFLFYKESNAIVIEQFLHNGVNRDIVWHCMCN